MGRHLHMNTNQPDHAAESFYHLAGVPLKDQACAGLACFAARKEHPLRWLEAMKTEHPVFCLGQCYCSPAQAGHDVSPHIAIFARESVLLGNACAGAVRQLDQYIARGGGAGMQRAMGMRAEDVISEVQASGLRGRGGAGFPTGIKWSKTAELAAPEKYVVANADEGDPGAFSDRLLMERDPFRLLEGMIIAAIATGATRGIIYLRQEYPIAAEVMRSALKQAEQAHWLGSDAMGGRRAFDIELVIGKGSYMCGEETAMLNAIEGRRPEARLRPPQITAKGLFGWPTLVNNVETLCAVPWIVEHGAGRFAALGTPASRGTKLISLNSLFRRPGLYEVEFGITVREIVDTLGQGIKRGNLKGVMIGGPLAGLIPPALFDTPLDYEALQAIDAAVGHGGVIAFNEDTSIAELVAEVFRFGAFESCGKCTPCHLGSPEISRAFNGVLRSEKMSLSRWHELVDALVASSLCGHGRGLGEFARSIERNFPQELDECFK
jgi:formate dehydrogenase iron-sulfur subunit